MSKRIATALGVTLVALLALDYGVWRVATGRLLAGYLAWQAGLAAQGWHAQSDPPVATGWPVAATIRLTQVRLGQTAPAGFGWSADQVTFGVSLLHPRTLAVTPAGHQTLEAPGWGTLRFAAGGMQVRAPLAAPIRSAAMMADGLTVATRFGDAVVNSVRAQADWTAGAGRLSLSGGPAALPPGHRWGLGETVAAAELTVITHGAWPDGPPAAAAARWRDQGGTVHVDHMALRWGSLDATGSGTVKLGDDLQPLADLDLKVVDPQAALSALADAGAISRGAATAGAAVLALLAVPATLAGQPGVLDLPLRVQGGTAYLGQIPLAQVPAIRWGGGQ